MQRSKWCPRSRTGTGSGGGEGEVFFVELVMRSSIASPSASLPHRLSCQNKGMMLSVHQQQGYWLSGDIVYDNYMTMKAVEMPTPPKKKTKKNY